MYQQRMLCINITNNLLMKVCNMAYLVDRMDSNEMD